MSGPNGMLYGGDEIGALVFDPGHFSFRVGYAQEDTPKAEIPAVVGVGPETPSIPEPEQKPDNNVTSSGTNSSRYFVDTTFLNVPRPGMEVVSYMKDGSVENWDLFEKVLDYAYSKVIKSSSEYHPVLFSEASWTTRPAREKLAELMFEKYNVPAFFLVKNAVLAAFANGKSTALVVDSGATHTSAIPVLDGYALSAASVRSSLGGDHLAQQARTLLSSLGIPLTPATHVQNKEMVREKEKPRYTVRPFPEGLTSSWQEYMTRQVLNDFTQTVVQVSECPYDERVAASTPAIHYELPCGYHQDFGPERFRLAETLFDHQMVGASQLVQTAVGMCDIDMRPAMWGSVVVTGGATLYSGWAERLSRDLSSRTPSSVRLKTIAANNSAERRFSAWIGGSILASIGSFQQMWISSQEYDEAGKGQVERKCP